MKHQPTPECSDEPSLAKPSFNRGVDTATLQLLSQWKTEDATRNPEEVHAAERELNEFKKSMNDRRTESGEPSLFP
jgi:hypothetical protein